ncbi:MAG: hypothetical protein WBB67_00580 [bacterium]
MDDKWQELRQLETQRSDITTKLAKIEEKKEMVSNGVYEKVKGEYEDKLKHIDADMSEHVDLIKEELTNIQDEETKMQSEEKDINLQIEEIELRYSIGEYDEESYTEQSEEKKETLDTTRTNLENLKKRKKWLEDFVQIKNIEETIEAETPAEPVAAEQTPEQPAAEIEIEEHLLEETLPEQTTKLDELLVEEEAVKQEVTEEVKTEEKPPAQPSAENEKNVPCPKCGHLNTLDSWYCEKCGAEILDSPLPK